MAIDLDALRKKHAELMKNTEAIGNNKDSFLMLGEGTTVVRILPGKDDDTLFYAETKIHRVRLPGKAYDNNIHCRKIKGEACPLCDLYFALWKTKIKEDEDLARNIKPRERYFVNVVERSTSKVKIFSLGAKIFKKIIDTMLDEDYGDITDLNKGFDFKVIKTVDSSAGGKSFPNYDSSQARPKSDPAGSKQEIAAYMESLHDIHRLVEVKSFDEVKEIAEAVAPPHLQGMVNSDESTTPKKSKVSDSDFGNMRA